MPRNKRKVTKMPIQMFVGNTDDDLPTAPMHRSSDNGPMDGRASSNDWGRGRDRPPRQHEPSKADDSNQWRRTGPSHAPMRNGWGSNRNSPAPFSTNNRFNPWEDNSSADTRPAHLRNRFHRGNTQDSRVATPIPVPRIEVAQPKKRVEKAAPTYERKKRGGQLLSENIKTNLISADQMHSPLEIAIEEHRDITSKELAASFQRLDLDVTPVADAALILCNSLHDKKFTAAQLRKAVKASNDVKAASSVLLATAKAVQAKGKATIALLIANDADKQELVALIGGGRTGDALNQFFLSEKLSFLAEDEAITRLTAILAEGADVATVLASLPPGQSPQLKPVVVMALIERLFDGKVLNLSVVDDFAPVLARCKEEEVKIDPDAAEGEGTGPSSASIAARVALEVDILFAAQRVWFGAGAVRAHIKQIFMKFYDLGVVSFEGFAEWRDDRSRGSKNKKPIALLAVVNWITEITPEPEEDDEEEADEEGQQEDDGADFDI